MEIQPSFRDLLELFNAHNVDYMIVGGYALAFHGAPRYTGDMDLFVKPDEKNAAKIIEALRVNFKVFFRCLIWIGQPIWVFIPININIVRAREPAWRTCTSTSLYATRVASSLERSLWRREISPAKFVSFGAIWGMTQTCLSTRARRRN